MITNSTEIRVALRNLHIFEDTLASLQEELAAVNPDLLNAAAPAYIRRIALLQSEIAESLFVHPSDVSKLVAALPLEVQAVG